MVAREAVIWGYRLLLGREPESEQIVAAHSRIADIEELRQAFFTCNEFAREHAVAGIPRLWVAAPVMRGERLMWLDLGDRYVSRGCLLDDYEPVETGFVRAVLKPGDVFVDVGANLGWFTLLASTTVGEQGHIYAFEPRDETEATSRRPFRSIDCSIKSRCIAARCLTPTAKRRWPGGRGPTIREARSWQTGVRRSG